MTEDFGLDGFVWFCECLLERIEVCLSSDAQ